MGDVILVLGLVVFFGGGWLLKNTDPKKKAKLLRYALIGGLIALAAVLALTGKGIFDLPIGAVVFWLLRNWIFSNFLGLGKLNGWLRGKQGKPEQPGSGQSRPEAEPRSGMSMSEAFQILGIEPGATVDQVREAHRELMLKIHPDRGGSTYLARQVNAARDVLLAGQ